ncbi:MAG: AAA family ATPase, partial [Endozoicomonas sp.]
MVLSKRNYSLAFTVLLIYTSTNTQSAQASQGDSLLKLIVISSIISSVEKVFIEPVFGPYILKWAENFHHPKILRGESSLVYLFRDKLRVCNRERFDYLPEIIQFHACRERPMHMDLNQLVYPPETKNEIDGFVKTLHYLIAEQRNLPNLLLYGRQGTGKTVLAEAIAHHFGFNFQPLSGSEIKKNPNEAIDSLYRAIQWAKRDGRYDNRPVLIFIDEMEAFMRKREDILMGLDYDLLSEFLALVNN